MKILVIGYAASGKSTFASTINKYYNYPLLHLDKARFKKNWEERTDFEMESIVVDFMKEENYILDGNYRRIASTKFVIADLIYIFEFNRFICLYQAIKRRIKYRNKSRDSITEGCKEKLDFQFLLWLLFKGRSKGRKLFYKELKEKYPNKVISFKNRRQSNAHLKKLSSNYV